jgi:hypothetical protein
MVAKRVAQKTVIVVSLIGLTYFLSCTANQPQPDRTRQLVRGIRFQPFEVYLRDESYLVEQLGRNKLATKLGRLTNWLPHATFSGILR